MLAWKPEQFEREGPSTAELRGGAGQRGQGKRRKTEEAILFLRRNSSNYFIC